MMHAAKRGGQDTNRKIRASVFYLLDDSIGDVVFVESDQRIHEAFRVH